MWFCLYRLSSASGPCGLSKILPFCFRVSDCIIVYRIWYLIELLVLFFVRVWINIWNVKLNGFSTSSVNFVSEVFHIISLFEHLFVFLVTSFIYWGLYFAGIIHRRLSWSNCMIVHKTHPDLVEVGQAKIQRWRHPSLAQACDVTNGGDRLDVLGDRTMKWRLWSSGGRIVPFSHISYAYVFLPNNSPK